MLDETHHNKHRARKKKSLLLLLNGEKWKYTATKDVEKKKECELPLYIIQIVQFFIK